jgi:small GTP-binding protein
MSRARKVMLLGEIGVGKSSLARRLVFDRFSSEYKPTIGVEVMRYNIPADALDGEGASLILWDTDGNFGDAIFRHVYLKQASAAIIVADKTRPDTIDAMLRLARGFAEVMPGRAMHFIINKDDLPVEDDAIRIDDHVRSAPIPQTSAVPLIRTSALAGLHVEEAFIATAKAIFRRGH